VTRPLVSGGRFNRKGRSAGGRRPYRCSSLGLLAQESLIAQRLMRLGRKKTSAAITEVTEVGVTVAT
jgi:hypothetical protein